MNSTRPGAQKIALTPEQVCAIIKSCGESHVRVLKFAGLYVQFERSAVAPAVAEIVSPPPATEMAETPNPIEEEKALLQKELAVRDDQLAYVMVENPVLAEQLLMDGDLAEDDDAEYDDEA